MVSWFVKQALLDVARDLGDAGRGWGTHETWMPDNARRHKAGCEAAIYPLQPGANTRVRSWTPTPNAQYLVTHNESISIADYFTLREGGRVVYRPTCHYAYHRFCKLLIIKQLQRARFGRRSERIDADQLALGLEDVETDKARAEAAQKPRTKRKDRKFRRCDNRVWGGKGE
jgi:homospermidine synthase